MHPLLFEPSKGWTYGAGMDWAGRTIEVVSGQTLETFMQTHIFTPLSMTSTTFRPELRDDFPARTMTMAWRDRPTNLLTAGKNPWGFPAKDCCGGCGLYSTADDYTKLLKAFLADGGVILKKESVDKIMTSQLVDPKYFLGVINGPGRAHLGQTWPAGAQATFGLSSSINLEDFPGRRPKGSANWSGMPGLHAWVDRETGIAGLLTTQVLPPGDPMVTKCLLELETALYTHVRST
jgi:CubicO group peptidase (beta-lactamase class C family)